MNFDLWEQNHRVAECLASENGSDRWKGVVALGDSAILQPFAPWDRLFDNILASQRYRVRGRSHH
jgi:hypothetical protein